MWQVSLVSCVALNFRSFRFDMISATQSIGLLFFHNSRHLVSILGSMRGIAVSVNKKCYHSDRTEHRASLTVLAVCRIFRGTNRHCATGANRCCATGANRICSVVQTDIHEQVPFTSRRQFEHCLFCEQWGQFEQLESFEQSDGWSISSFQTRFELCEHAASSNSV